MKPVVSTHARKTCGRMKTVGADSKHIRNPRRRLRRGSEILETARVLPILLLIAFGTVEFGFWFYVEHNLQGAAREGARLAITSGATKTSVEAAVTAVMNAAGVPSGKYTIAITTTSDVVIAPESAVAGTAIKVTVSATWGMIGMRPLGVLDASKTINGAAVMRKES